MLDSHTVVLQATSINNTAIDDLDTFVLKKLISGTLSQNARKNYST